jgi:hypothetical protein
LEYRKARKEVRTKLTDRRPMTTFKVKSFAGLENPKKRNRVLYRNQCPRKRID